MDLISQTRCFANSPRTVRGQVWRDVRVLFAYCSRTVRVHSNSKSNEESNCRYCSVVLILSPRRTEHGTFDEPFGIGGVASVCGRSADERCVHGSSARYG